MQIEELKDSDIASCLAIYNYYIKNTTVSLEYDELDFKTFSARTVHIRKKYPYLVLKDHGEVIGFSYLSSFNERKGYDRSADLTIYLAPNKVHHGYGKILLDAIILKAKEYHFYHLISLVTSENISSIHFHTKNGFVLEGNLKKVAFKFDRELDLFMFNKNIREK